MGGAQEVWPELGFSYDDEFGLQSFEVWLHAEFEIEWEVENIPCAEVGTSQLLASVGRGGDYNPMLRISRSQLADQLADGQDFAYRDCVDPDGGSALRANSLRDDSEAFAESAAVFAVTQHLEDPVGAAEQQSCGE